MHLTVLRPSAQNIMCCSLKEKNTLIISNVRACRWEKTLVFVGLAAKSDDGGEDGRWHQRLEMAFGLVNLR